MSESTTITTDQAPNGHAATFTAEAPNVQASPYTPEPPANDAAPAPRSSQASNNERIVHLMPGEDICLVIGPGSTAKQPSAAVPPNDTPSNVKLHKPVDLILANAAHNAGIAMQSFARLTGASLAEADETFVIDIARKMLCEIAHDASPAKVLFALGAIGGPASPQDVAQRMQAARDAAAA